MAERYCPYCGQTKENNNFIIDYRNSNRRNAYLPYCKKCTDAIVQRQTQEYGLVAGIWSAAMVNNVPMINSVWKSAKKYLEEGAVNSPFAVYYKFMKDEYGIYDGVWESDCWYGNFADALDESNANALDMSPEEYQQLFKDWGKFVNEEGELEMEAYEFLVPRYQEYTEGVVGLTSAMSMQFRNLCKAEWQKIKADESGDISAIDKAQKLVNNLLSNLKLDDFAVEKSDTEKFIDRLIWRIEETEPAEEEDVEKFTDIAGYEEIYNQMMRSMRNLICGTRDYPEITKEEL